MCAVGGITGGDGACCAWSRFSCRYLFLGGFGGIILVVTLSTGGVTGPVVATAAGTSWALVLRLLQEAGVTFVLGLGPLQTVVHDVLPVLGPLQVLEVAGPKRCKDPLQDDKLVVTVFVLIKEMLVELALLKLRAATLGREPIGEDRAAEVVAVDT